MKRHLILLLITCVLAFSQSTNYPQVSTAPTYATDSGSSSAYVVRSLVCPASLYTGLIVSWLPANANSTTTPTLNYCKFGGKVITKLGGNILAINDLIPTSVALTLYDGATWQLQNPASTSVVSRAVAAPSAINFGTIQSGSSSLTQNVTISNTGSTQALTVVSAAFTGNADFQSANVSACNGPLAAQASCSISVFFNPSATGAETASLLINTDVSPQIVIALSGAGSVATSYPVSASGTDTGFGVVTSNDLSFNCTMAPPAAPSGACGPVNYAASTNVIFTATANVGSTFQGFNGCGLSVSPGTYTVTSPGCTVVADFSSNAPVNIASIAVAPTTINFGTVQTSTDSTENVTISNTSSSIPLSINSVIFTGNADFSSTNASICNGTLAPSASCVVAVVFSPTSAVAETGTITVNSNASGAAPTISLLGTGIGTPTFLVGYNGTGTGSGSIASNEGTPLINCSFTNGAGPVCGANYVTGSTPIITATAASGSFFTGFSGTGCGTTSPATLTVSGPLTCTAGFNISPPIEIITITGLGPGTGTVTSDVADANGVLNCVSTIGVTTPGGGTGCSGSYQQDTVITLTESPNASSNFIGWSIPTNAGGTCGAAATCQVTLAANTTVAANFGLTSAPVDLTQTNSNFTVSSATISHPWGSTMIAGDDLVCAAGWPDATTTVVSLTDTKGNSYIQVPTVSPKHGTNTTQVVYYAQNIAAAAAGANTTTMTLNTAASSSISVTNLALSGGTAAPFTTLAVTPGANHLILIKVSAILASGNGPGAISSITGNSLTWVKVMSTDYGAQFGTGRIGRSELWRAMGSSPTTGAITITFGTSPTGVSWSVNDISGTDTSGTNGSGAIGITASATTSDGLHGSPATVTMGTFGSASNGTFMAVGGQGSITFTAGAGLTDLGHSNNGGDAVNAGWAAGNVSPVTVTWPSGNENTGIMGVEIKVPVAQTRRDLRCGEYSGVLVSGNPIDVSSAATGTSATAAPGSITPLVANDLIVNFTYSNQSVNTAASGFTQLIKNIFGDTMEDIEGAPIAAYNPADALTASGNWISTQVAFKPSGAPAPTTFSVTVSGGTANGNGNTTSNAGTPNLNCTTQAGQVTSPNVCSTAVVPNSTITLTANPAAGSVFGGWQGPTGCTNLPSCQLANITANQNIIATYNLSTSQRCTFGTFGPNAWPDSCWQPFSKTASPVNVRIPASPRLATNSANIVARLVQDSNASIMQFTYPVAGGGTCAHPYFFSKSTDPLATVTCTGAQQPGVSGSSLRVPAVARPNLTCSDHHISIVDQSTSTVWDFYQFPTGGVNGGPFTVSGCGKDNIQTGTGTGTDVTASNFDAMTGMIRGQELQQNTINHALFGVTSCDNNTSVYPSQSGHQVPCNVNDGLGRPLRVNAPPLGSLLYLDYTDSQIGQLSIPAWEKAVVTAIAHYGVYVGDQGGPFNQLLLTGIIEGGETYRSYGATEPIVQVANANGIGSNGLFYLFQMSGINWATHLHVIAPCVVLSMTGQPGGC